MPQSKSLFSACFLTVFLVCVIIFLLFATIVNASPKIYSYNGRKTQQQDSSAVSQDIMYNYLMEFDYLPKSDIETGALRTEEQLKEAIRRLQRFGNIPVTGEVDAATQELIRKPRCGVGDNDRSENFSPDNLHHHRMKRFVLQGAKWNRTDLTWSLVNQSMEDSGQVRSILSQALKVWELNSKLSFREVYSDQADIQVLFARRDHGDGYKFDGPGKVLAHAFYPSEGRGGDAHFDSDENWHYSTSHDRDGTSLIDVALHEFGHSLGLGHSAVEGAVMFPWYHGYQVNDTLPDDDRFAIQQLYGSKKKMWGPFRPYMTPPPTPPRTTTTTTTTTMRPLVYRPSYQNPWYPVDDPRQSKHPYNPRPPYEPYYPPHRHHTTTTTTTTTPPPTTTTLRPTQASRTSRPRTNHKHKVNKNKPDTCLTQYDAISMIRSELFIFRGRYVWRFGNHGMYPGSPFDAKYMWKSLPEDFNKIDAVYESRNGKITFFIGRHYYIFNPIELERGYPQPLTTLGLPASLSHIDAAFTWGHNNRTYLFSGTLYWRLDEDTGRVELDYPRDMSIWSGIGYYIDSAFQYTNRKTYFFKGLGYWEFNDDRMMVAHRRPKLSARKWMNCPKRVNEVDEDPMYHAPLISETTERPDDGENAAPRGWTTTLIGTSIILAIITIRLA